MLIFPQTNMSPRSARGQFVTVYDRRIAGLVGRRKRRPTAVALVCRAAIFLVAITATLLGAAAVQRSLPPSCNSDNAGDATTPTCWSEISKLSSAQKVAIARDELVYARRQLPAGIAKRLLTELPDDEARGLDAVLLLWRAEKDGAETSGAIAKATDAAQAANDKTALAYLLMATAKIAIATQDWNTVASTLEDAAALASRQKLTGLLSEILYARGEHGLREKDFAGAEPWLRRAYEGFVNAGQQDRAGEACQLLTGAYAYNMNNTAASLEEGARDAKIVDHPCRVAALFYRGQRLDLAFDEMEPLAERALVAIEARGLATMAPGLLNSRGMAAGRVGEYGNAIRYYEQAREGFEAVGNRFMAAAVACNQAKLLSEMGATAEAIPIFEESMAIFRSSAPDRVDLMLKAERQIGLAHERAGRIAEAATWFERAYESSQSFTIRYYDGLVGADFARALYALGEEKRALSMAQMAVETVLSTKDAADVATAWRTLTWLGSRYLERGDVQQADAALNRASALMDPDGEGPEALYDGQGALYTRLEYARGMAEVLTAMDNPAMANQYAQVGLRLSENRLKEEKIRAVANAELQRELAKNELRLTGMERDAAVAQLTVRNSYLRMLVSSGVALIAGLLAFVMFWFYRTQKQLADTKETFLSEIHHRVGNNMQLITSLLNTETRSGEFGSAELTNRVQTMSLIHNHLYQNRLDQSIDGAVFLEELAALLKRGLGRAGVEVWVNADPVTLETAAVTPVGLVVCEAVNNAFKYAFENGESGCILISLRDEGAVFNLEVRDDGGGAGADGVIPSQGSRLMLDLAMQLGGEYSFENTPDGVAVRVDGIPKTVH